MLTSAELQQALRAARAGGQNGERDDLTRVHARRRHRSCTGACRTTRPCFIPGVTDIGAATTIALGLSEEHSGADITIQFVPTATISGTITDPSGVLPQAAQVALVPAGPQTELLAGRGTARHCPTTPRPDGTLHVQRRRAGAYTVKASSGRAPAVV